LKDGHTILNLTSRPPLLPSVKEAQRILLATSAADRTAAEQVLVQNYVQYTTKAAKIATACHKAVNLVVDANTIPLVEDIVDPIDGKIDFHKTHLDFQLRQVFIIILSYYYIVVLLYDFSCRLLLYQNILYYIVSYYIILYYIILYYIILYYIILHYIILYYIILYYILYYIILYCIILHVITLHMIADVAVRAEVV